MNCGQLKFGVQRQTFKAGVSKMHHCAGDLGFTVIQPKWKMNQVTFLVI
jgi:hypothetical protein